MDAHSRIPRTEEDPIVTTTAPSAPRTAHAYAYDALRTQILAGELPPGSPLIQTSLAAALGVSLTPVREALRDLTTEGLVTQEAHRGSFVAQLDVADAIEINEIRLRLEPDAIAAAVPVLSSAELDRADALYESLQSATGGEWVALNRDLHLTLIDATPSRRLRSILGSLVGFAALYVGVAISHRQGAEPQKEHREILDACRRRDAAAAHAAVTRHLQHSLDSLRQAAARD